MINSAGSVMMCVCVESRRVEEGERKDVLAKNKKHSAKRLD